MIRNLTSAIRTLTIIPVPGKETDDFSRCLMFFPWIGLLIGAIVAGFAIVLVRFLPSDYPVVILVLGAATVITGCLHIDGLADVFDGFGGGKSREQILTIFKDSRLGTYGVTVLVFDLLLKFFLYFHLIINRAWAVLILSFVVSRGAQAVSLCIMPYSGLNPGTASAFANNKAQMPVIISLTIAVILSFFLINQYVIMISLVTTCILCGLFLYICQRKIAGITGDCIGAVNEIAEIAVLFSGYVFFHSL